MGDDKKFDNSINHSLISPRKVRQMKDQAAKKAEQNVDKGWMKKSGLDYTYRIIAYMAACGATQKAIASALKMTPGTVSKALKREDVDKEIISIQDRLFGLDPTRVYQRTFPKALKTATSIMADDSVKPGIRLNAAQDFMDRHAGRAPQKIEVERSEISILIAMLDKSAKNTDVSQENQKEIIDAEFTDPEPEKAPDFSSWVEDNL